MLGKHSVTELCPYLIAFKWVCFLITEVIHTFHNWGVHSATRNESFSHPCLLLNKLGLYFTIFLSSLFF
jgi:hypothetical protein